MVFEKTQRTGYCEICGGEHSEEHKSCRGEQRIIQLTGTGKILPAIVLVAIFLLIFVSTLSWTGITP